jgi:transcriptional regulator with XRE-family HTH domain
MLTRRRRALGWSLRQAGREAGCSFSTVWKLEHGQRAPSVPLARDLASAYLLGPADTAALLSAALPGVGRDYQSGWR